jgi:hypothetical protein
MFLNGLMLLGLSAAVVPLVLHLLSRARYRTVDWGAMMFLRGADARQRQSTRFNQVLLVMVRMGVVALVAFAMARPVVRGAWFGAASQQPLTAAIVLDCSASMSFDENGRSRFELARGAARQVLAGLRRGDRAILIRAGREPSQQDLRPTPELRAVDARLASFQPEHGRADLVDALNVAWERLAAHEPTHRQVYVITDRQALSWRGAEGFKPPWLNQPRDASVPTDVFVIPIGSPAADNMVVERVDVIDPPAIKGQPVELDVRIRNYGAVQRASLPLVVRAGERKLFETKVNLAPDASATFRAQIKEGFAAAGSHVVTASITSTGYTADDRLDTVVDVIEPVRVLVLSGDERPPGALRSESDYVRVALAPYQTATGKPGRDPCVVEVKPVEQWADVYLPGYDVVILANVERFDPGQARQLEQFVYAGGGVLIAPGNLSRVDNYNDRFYRGGAGLLPAELSPATPGDWSQATSLLGWRPEHPVFRFLRGRPDPLPSSTIGRYFPARPRQPEARSLAEFASGWPLLIEATRQELERRGRVILITTPLDIDWGNLPFSSFYLPFMQSLVRYLAGGTVDDRNLSPGEPIVATFEASQAGKTVTLQPPGDDSKPVPLEVTSLGGQAEARYANTRIPGEYTLTVPQAGSAPPQTLHYVVTAPRDESDLSQLSEDRWRQLSRSLGLERLDAAEQSIPTVMAESRDGREVWATLLCAALVLGVVELAMARAFTQTGGDEGTAA